MVSGAVMHLRPPGSLPIDLVTIDGIFIQNLGRSTGDRLFVRTLVDIAQRLGIATLAEWVTIPERRHAAANGGSITCKAICSSRRSRASGRSDETGPAAGVKRSRSICAPVRPVSPACRPFAFSRLSRSAGRAPGEPGSGIPGRPGKRREHAHRLGEEAHILADLLLHGLEGTEPPKV